MADASTRPPHVLQCSPRHRLRSGSGDLRSARTPVATVVGIDIDPRMVELARANAGPLRGRRCEEVVEHAEGDSGNEAIRRSFPDKPWLAARTGLDAISARSCLLNLSDLESLLRRAAGYTSSVTRVLRPMQSVTPPTNAVGDSPRTPLALAAGKLAAIGPNLVLPCQSVAAGCAGLRNVVAS